MSSEYENPSSRNKTDFPRMAVMILIEFNAFMETVSLNETTRVVSVTAHPLVAETHVLECT
jgi:hypothetical protein